MSSQPTHAFEEAPRLSGPRGPRRRFLRLAGLATAAALAGPTGLRLLARASGGGELPPSSLRTSYAPYPAPGARFAMVIDVKKCIGCRRCAYACRSENNVGRDSGFAWIQLHRMERGSIELEGSVTDYTRAAEPNHWYLPAACMQCENPPCVQACPVRATWREPDGIVLIDYDKCTGCRYCIVHCPYGARHFNWKRPNVPEAELNPAVPLRPIGVVEKCTFCVHRTRKGGTTACVEACPVGARSFGDLNDSKSGVNYRIRTRMSVRLKEQLGTRPRLYYVG